MTAPLLVLSPIHGRIHPGHLAALEAQGWTVHRAGRAAYVHQGDLHAIFGTWADGEPPPRWAGRLGTFSAAWIRRCARKRGEQAWRRMQRDRRGRFAVRRPWFSWPAVQVYSWQDATTVFERAA